MRTDPATADPAYRSGAAALLLALATILTAIAFERLGGFPPCPLCLMQRWAYYAAIPSLFVGLVLLATGWRVTAGLVFLAVALAFLANAGLGVYHAGAEWGYWPGPDVCAAAGRPISPRVEDLLSGAPPVRCDRAPWSFLGLSFAGWNAVVSLALFTATIVAAFDAASRRP